MVMSRAINSRSLIAPDNFIYAITYEDRSKYRDYLDEYMTVNQGTLDEKPQNYYAKMPSVKLTIRSMYSGTVELWGEVNGSNFLEGNSIGDSVKTLNQISAELTLFDILSSTKTIEPKLRKFNEYTKKLFEDINNTSSVTQKTTYDYSTMANIANPAYEAFTEWCSQFEMLLTSIGLGDYGYDVRNFWRVDGVLTSTQSWEDSKYNLIGFFRNSLIKTDYYGHPIGPTKLHPMFKTNPLQAMSNYIMSAQNSYYDNRFETLASALQNVAMANALLTKNPQIKTMGRTELSAYNHKSYYFTGDIEQMTKKMTDFLSVDNIPDFTTKDLSKLGKDFADYVFGFKTTTKKNLEVQREQLDELNMNKFNKGITAMTAHWEEIVKHLYKQNAIDEIGLLYSNLLFPQISNNYEFYKELLVKLNPVQTNYGWNEDLGDGYKVTLYIHQNQLAINFVKSTPMSGAVKGDFYDEVKANIISLGVPQYLQQPLRQILADAREVIDSNSDFELRQVASKIYHIENSRNAGRAKIQEKLQQLHDITFV
jgi:hypothetical protein